MTTAMIKSPGGYYYDAATDGKGETGIGVLWLAAYADPARITDLLIELISLMTEPLTVTLEAEIPNLSLKEKFTCRKTSGQKIKAALKDHRQLIEGDFHFSLLVEENRDEGRAVYLTQEKFFYIWSDEADSKNPLPSYQPFETAFSRKGLVPNEVNFELYDGFDGRRLLQNQPWLFSAEFHDLVQRLKAEKV